MLRDIMPFRRLTRADALKVAEAQANRLLRLAGVKVPPVGEQIIAELPRIQIERVVPAQAQAATKWSHGRWLVLINGDMSQGRQRWSLAHELKHILDHPFVTIVYPRQGGRADPVEQACDYFAACLLVPRRWLRQAWADGECDIQALARRFEVTPEAIRLRLLQVGLIEPTSHCLAKEV